MSNRITMNDFKSFCFMRKLDDKAAESLEAHSRHKELIAAVDASIFGELSTKEKATIELKRIINELNK